MAFILTNLDIKCKSAIYDYSDKNNIGHQRNFVHLIDNKYNIDGIFFLDATWDSRKNDGYLDNYQFFLKPFRFFKFITKTENIISPDKFSILEKSNEEILKEFDKPMNFKAIASICMLNNEINPNELSLPNLFSKSKEELKEIASNVLLKFNKKININAFKNALYKVRKIEYINGIIDKPLNESDIDSICNKYYKENSETKLLKVLGLYQKPTLDKDLKEAKASSIEEDLLRMKLLKSMKAKLNDLPTNDYIKRM